MTREEFMDIVYAELHSDADNSKANRIIDAADEYAAEQKHCDDAISRENVIEDVVKCTDMNEDTMEVLEEKINKLPPVTPQPKYGKWIESKCYDDRDHFYICSECGRCINLICGAKLSDYPYCHCGAKMEEVEKK